MILAGSVIGAVTIPFGAVSYPVILVADPSRFPRGSLHRDPATFKGDDLFVPFQGT